MPASESPLLKSPGITSEVVKDNCTACRVCEQVLSLEHVAAINPCRANSFGDKKYDGLVHTPRITGTSRGSYV